MNVLVVDDNEADQFISEFVINQFDSQIVVSKAYDGKEALEFLGSCEEQPALVFLDINMPGMNGFDFLAQYHANFKDNTSTTIMLTSSIRDDDYQKCIAYPCVKKVLTKPLDVDVVSDCFDLPKPTH